MPVITNSFSLQLPNAKAESTPIMSGSTIYLALTKSGELHWNGTLIDQKSLIQQLDALPNKANINIFLQADRSLAFERIAQLLAFIQSQGIGRIHIETNPTP